MLGPVVSARHRNVRKKNRLPQDLSDIFFADTSCGDNNCPHNWLLTKPTVGGKYLLFFYRKELLILIIQNTYLTCARVNIT